MLAPGLFSRSLSSRITRPSGRASSTRYSSATRGKPIDCSPESAWVHWRLLPTARGWILAITTREVDKTRAGPSGRKLLCGVVQQVRHPRSLRLSGVLKTDLGLDSLVPFPSNRTVEGACLIGPLPCDGTYRRHGRSWLHPRERSRPELSLTATCNTIKLSISCTRYVYQMPYKSSS